MHSASSHVIDNILFVGKESGGGSDEDWPLSDVSGTLHRGERSVRTYNRHGEDRFQLVLRARGHSPRELLRMHGETIILQQGGVIVIECTTHSSCSKSGSLLQATTLTQWQ